MKTKLLTLLAVFLISLTASSSIIDLRLGKMENMPANGLNKAYRSVLEKDNSYIVKYEFDYVEVTSHENGEVLLSIIGFGEPNTFGVPATLSHLDYYKIDYGCNAVVRVTDCKYTDYDLHLAPSIVSKLLGDGQETSERHEISPYSGFYPNNIVNKEFQGIRGDNEIASVRINPIQYDYEHQTVRAYSMIEYEVSYNPSTSIDTIKALSEDFDDKDIIDFITPPDVLALTSDREQSDDIYLPDTNLDYLKLIVILTSEELAPALERYAAHKKSLGYKIESMIVNKGNDFATERENLKKFVRQFANYKGFKEKSLFIIGDQDHVPTYLISEGHFNQCATDLYYLVDSYEMIPPMSRGRIPVRNLEEANVVISKIINYEMNPPRNNSFYESALSMAYYETASPKTDVSGNTYICEDRFYKCIETSERIRQALESENINVNRIYGYSTTPDRWSNGDPIPLSLTNAPIWNKSANISSYINNGISLIHYLGHGNPAGLANPTFSEFDASKLSNGSLLPIAFFNTCSAGAYHRPLTSYELSNWGNQCISRTLLTNSNGGALAVIASTSDSFAYDCRDLSMMLIDAIYPNERLQAQWGGQNHTPVYKIGNIVDFALANLRSKTQNRIAATEQFQVLGDPTLDINTEKPQSVSNILVHIEKTTGTYAKATISSENGVEYTIVRSSEYLPYEMDNYKGPVTDLLIDCSMDNSFTIHGHNLIPYTGHFTNKNLSISAPSASIGTCSYNGSKLSVNFSVKGTYNTYHLALYSIYGEFIKAKYGPFTIRSREEQWVSDIDFSGQSGTFIIAVIVDGKSLASKTVQLN